MQIHVLFFGGLQDRVATAEERIEIPQQTSVRDLKQILEERHPFLVGRWGSVRIAVNHSFCDDSTPVPAHAEVALIPPVAGGSDGRVLLTHQPLTLDLAVRQIMGPGLGGLCIFAGVVRDHANGRRVVSIDYTAYEPMAIKVMADILRQEEELHHARVACHHRTGHLLVGEMAVIVAAAATHRAEAFDACRSVIEALKRNVPIWKHEMGPDGSVWVGMGP
jgi:molybdopterin synthase catalytic subunit